MLTFFIGLPRTGTTYLQMRLLPRVPDLRLVHRALGPKEEKACAVLRKYVGASSLTAGLMRQMITSRAFAQLKKMDESEIPAGVIVSDEHLSVQSGEFWRGEGPDPERVAQRLHALTTSMPPQFGPAKVLIGLRAQETWLASSYADSARHTRGSSQADFDERMMRIAATDPLTGPLGWLDHAHVFRAFAERFGADFVILYHQEELADRPGRVLRRMGSSLGGLDFAKVHRRIRRRHNKVPYPNKLSVGENSWQMGNEGAVLELRDEVAEALRARFRTSNEQLASLSGAVAGSALLPETEAV